MMRVIAASPERALRTDAGGSVRSANIEMLGLLACSAVILLGLWITSWGRLAQPVDGLTAAAAGPKADGKSSTQPAPGARGAVNLRELASPDALLPLLTMFESAFERQVVAKALYQRATAIDSPLEHVGGLAEATIPAAAIEGDRRFVRLREQLQRRPGAASVPALTSADLAGLKPSVVVRSAGAFTAAVRRAALWFFAAFWLAHLVRRWRRKQDDPMLLPLLLILAGIGMMSMIALRDPLRDMIIAAPFAAGVAGGVLLLLAASEIDFEASALRRSVLVPLAFALGLAALLLIFGKGPGSSGVKVNLLGVQPVEAIRLLVVFALAAFFARRLDFLREFSEPPTAARPWLRYIRMPRWKDIRPVIVAMSLVLLFFFLQKDLGPALVLTFVFLALYGIARGRAAFVMVGLAMLLAGFAAAYWIGYPATVRQRVMIWSDPWNNGVPGGNQVAHGLWALSTGSIWGSGPGLGSPRSIPAGHTDFVLAAIGEELGFVGLAVIVGLYGMLSWRCLRIAIRAPGDYTAFLATGVALALVVQAFVIGSGLLGLFPLSGVVTPFLSYGRSSMLANFLAVGVVLAIARRRGPVRQHLLRPLRALGAVLAIATVGVVGRAAWVQVVKADDFATASSLSEQADGGYRFEYNPRLITAARAITRGTIYDRNGLPVATSKPDEISTLSNVYREAGLVPERPCAADEPRCYPLGGPGFSVIGDWTSQANWGASNSSYLERESDARLSGYDDHQQIVDVVNPRTGKRARTLKRDYRELLPLVRHRHDPSHPAVQALLNRPRDLHTVIDARLQLRAAAALRGRIEGSGHARGAAVVLDVDSGDVLASVSYPWPEQPGAAGPAAAVRRVHTTEEDDVSDRLLDRSRYGLYPPGSTFKLVVAAAALRTSSALQNETFACVRLPGGRVGNYIRGWTRPVRDDELDHSPHGDVDLRRGTVVSCNAYFAQLAMRVGPQPIVDAASIFQIDAAAPATAAALQRTLPHAGYGQADVLVSPLKMARVAAAIAGRGIVRPVQWVAPSGAAAANGARFLDEAGAGLLSRYMREAVTSGTGRSLASNPMAIAGKTGTAEVSGNKSHSWFAGFAPFGGPDKIAFAVIVENAGYGARAAAPIAGDIVTAAKDVGLIK